MQEVTDLAVRFVNSLVPGSFENAKSMLTKDCKYDYSEKMLVGPDNVVRAFEASHANAKTTLDAIEYLPAKVISVDDNVVMIGVQDKIFLRNREHIYSDRLEIEVATTSSGLKVSRVKWCPIPIEREKLTAFRNG